MKKKFVFLKYLLLIMLAVLSINKSLVVEAAVGPAPTVKYSATLSSSYYNSVSGKTGDSLLEGLAALSLTNHKYYTTYEEIKGGNAYSDRDPNNSNKMIDFYTGWSIPNDWDDGATWNREHVWCQSLSNGLYGTTGAGSDIHHIRPLISSINSGRNNGLFTDTEHCGSIPLTKYYYNGTKVPAYTGQWTGCYSYNQDYWEPRDEEKGDVARILMYLYMHYSKEISANSSNSKAGSLLITNIVYTSSKTSSAAWDMLVEWNELDPVSTFEKNRNNYCASVTGVRNPFIDHPEYANAIWGDGTLNGGSSSGGSTGNENSGSNSDTTGGTTTETITVKRYRQLKSANGITVGSKIIIAAKDYNYAMNTNQKTNNRGQTAITKYTEGSYTYLEPSSTTQILEVKSSSNGAYSLYTGSGYLASASNDANILQTKSSIGSGKNAYWNISFSNGAAKIVSAGSYSRNTIRYNSSSSLFSCYEETNSQKDVAIFKEYEEKVTVVVPSPETGGSSNSGSFEYPEANSLITIEKAIEVANAAGTTFTTNKYKISGTVSSIENTTYGDLIIKDESGNSIYIYGVYNSDGTIRYDSLGSAQPQVGDEVTLLGVLGLYETTPEMKNGWILEHNKSVSNLEEIANEKTNFYLSFDFGLDYGEGISDTYANVALLFGASVNASLFEGYTVSGGVLIDNAAKYKNTTIAEAYEANEFNGIKTSKDSLTIVDGKYSVGSLIEIIDGVVIEENKKYLEYEFVAAAYFTLVDETGNSKTIVLQQEAYSVKTVVAYYIENSASLGFNAETLKAIENFGAFIA